MLRDEFWQALRALRARVPFVSAAVLITSLAIGANIAVFSLVNAVLVSPLPFPDPSRLVEVNGRRADVDRDPLSLPDYLDLRDGNRTFEQLAAGFQWSANVTGGEAERLQGMRATANLFTLLGSARACDAALRGQPNRARHDDGRHRRPLRDWPLSGDRGSVAAEIHRSHDCAPDGLR